VTPSVLGEVGSIPTVGTTYSRVHIQHALIADLRNLTFEPSILTLTDHLATREVVAHQLIIVGIDTNFI
jgi:hypothetical protein